MMYLAYDTETNGLPLSWECTDLRDGRNWPRVWQVGAILFDEFGFPAGSLNAIVRPDGWTLPKTDFFDLNAPSVEHLMDTGRPMAEVLEEFHELSKQAEATVCHNASFDFPVLTCEMYRYHRLPKGWLAKPRHCTKLLSENVCQIPGAIPGKFKWPTLQEAHKHFFGREFSGAHDAMADVQATVDVFMEVKHLI